VFEPVFMRLALAASIATGLSLGVLGVYLVIRRVVLPNRRLAGSMVNAPHTTRSSAPGMLSPDGSSLANLARENDTSASAVIHGFKRA
jgi:hypothetical protein